MAWYSSGGFMRRLLGLAESCPEIGCSGLPV
jgi:hypothetical protein